jgi:hypothetical protein
MTRTVQGNRESFPSSPLRLYQDKSRRITADPVAFRTRSRVRSDSCPASEPLSTTTSPSGTEPPERRIKMCMAVDRLLVQNKEDTGNGEGLAGKGHTQTVKSEPARPRSMKLPSFKSQPIKYDIVKSPDRNSCHILTTEDQVKYERSLERVLGDLELPFSQTVPAVGTMRQNNATVHQKSH